MASQATLDKAASFRKQHQENDARLLELNKLPTSDATSKEIRKLKNANSAIEREFATDRDLANLSLGNTTPAERLGLIGLGVSPALIPVAAIVKANEVSNKVEPAAHKGTPDNATITKTDIAENPATKLKPLSNPLHNYPSYTYGLSLHLLSKDEYNTLVKHPQNYIPNRVLIASAGRHDPKTFARSVYFSEDFYFDNLNMNTVIGLNENSRSTNAITINFSIIEPYGITLLNRILEVNAADDIKSKNYLSMPYVLQVDFYGIDDSGVIVGKIQNQTKTIPIQLLKMDVKTGVKGTEYQFQAVPYNHSAYNVTTISPPIHLEVTANSLTSFFRANRAETETIIRNMHERDATIENFGYSNLSSGRLNFSGANAGTLADNQTYISPNRSAGRGLEIATSDPIYKVKSYAEGINGYYQNLMTKKKSDAADQYFFNFHPDIIDNGGGEFDLENLSNNNTSMSDTNNPISMKLGNDARIFSINAGTSIDAVINFAMRNSKYIQRQMIIPENYNDTASYLRAKDEFEKKPLNWYKIVPTIELTAFDEKTNQWSRNITYNIIPYKKYNNTIPHAPQGTASSPVKVYNYYYTGKNDDIIDLNIEFNAMYYTAITSYVSHMETVAGLKPSPADDEQSQAEKGPWYKLNAGDIQPQSFTYGTNTRVQGSGSNVTSKDSAAADTEQSILTAAGADMLNVKVKIIGDPMFIKQDDIFYPPNMKKLNEFVGSSVDPRLVENGSLGTDTGEVYVQLTFRSPDDIDDLTGMMKFNPKYQQSVFSGMYRVLTVDSTFSGGQFVQTLDMVRLPKQTRFDYTTEDTVALQKENAVNTGREEKTPVIQVTNDTKVTAPVKVEDVPAPESRPIQDIVNRDIEERQRKLMEIINKQNATVTITPLLR